jgi:hypothetical protein
LECTEKKAINKWVKIHKTDVRATNTNFT